jgi:hypothetical protein
MHFSFFAIFLLRRAKKWHLSLFKRNKMRNFARKFRQTPNGTTIQPPAKACTIGHAGHVAEEF